MDRLIGRVELYRLDVIGYLSAVLVVYYGREFDRSRLDIELDNFPSSVIRIIRPLVVGILESETYGVHSCDRRVRRTYILLRSPILAYIVKIYIAAAKARRSVCRLP